MDAKITKERLTGFLQYEWLKIVALVLGVIFLFSLIFMSFDSPSRHLNKGQMFFVYTSPDFTEESTDNLKAFASQEGLFSYEVRQIGVARLTGIDVDSQLSAFLSVGRADVMLCSDYEENGERSYFKEYVETYYATDLDTLLVNAKAYAKKFQTVEGEDFSFSNVSNEKAEEAFAARHKGDAWLRAGEISVEDEKERIEKLFTAIVEFEKLLGSDDAYFSYYQSSRDEAPKRYGIKLWNLPTNGEKTRVDKYATVAIDEEEKTAKYSTLYVFDTERFQPDLEYEILSFINALVKKTSTLLDA